MSDEPGPIIAAEAILRRGTTDDPAFTNVRCSNCGAMGHLPTASVPLVPGVDPVRDDDGVRLGLCPRCSEPRPNRAERRRRRG